MERNGKRPRGESNSDYESDQPGPSRIRQGYFGDQVEPIQLRETPTFISVIRGAMRAETIKSISLSLEPTIRRVIREEVQFLLLGTNPVYGSRQYYIENPHPIPQDPQLQTEKPRTLKLIFTNQVSEPIFAGTDIKDVNGNPLQVQLVDVETGEICVNVETKLKLVVIDGDLEEEGCDGDKFISKIVPSREGKGALLLGKTIIPLKRGMANLEGISFSDNSKWIRSGKFRLGICVDSETCFVNGTRIKEGLSEKFVVKDHRGIVNQKHYPPMLCLEDKTWRLEKIAKDGEFHKRLLAKGIKTVQDLLRMQFTNSNELQNNILKMKKSSWVKLINHANNCPMGENSYLFRKDETVIRFDPIGKILEVSLGGLSFSYDDLLPETKNFVHGLAPQAYEQWDRLEKVSIHLPLNANNSNLPNRSMNNGYGNTGDLERVLTHSSFMNSNVDGLGSDMNFVDSTFQNHFNSYQPDI